MRGLASQKVALEGASGEARKKAEALGESANTVRLATGPAGQRQHYVFGSDGENGGRRRSDARGAQGRAVGSRDTCFKPYGSRPADGCLLDWIPGQFDQVDTALGQAVTTLSQSTSEQQQRLETHVQAVDKGLSDAIGRLAGFLTQMSESAESIADSMDAAKNWSVAGAANGLGGVQQ